MRRPGRDEHGQRPELRRREVAEPSSLPGEVATGSRGRPGTGARARCPRSPPTSRGGRTRAAPGTARRGAAARGTAARRPRRPRAPRGSARPPQHAGSTASTNSPTAGTSRSVSAWFASPTPNSAAVPTIARSARGARRPSGARLASPTAASQRSSPSVIATSSAMWSAWVSAATPMGHTIGVSANPTRPRRRAAPGRRGAGPRTRPCPRRERHEHPPTGGSSGTPARRTARGRRSRPSRARRRQGSRSGASSRGSAAPSGPRPCPTRRARQHRRPVDGERDDGQDAPATSAGRVGPAPPATSQGAGPRRRPTG